ncbi:hypothetical protein LPJ72_005363 [Coemansia sp. Benny D160-2]|nr:hypothetical protein LPJ72_005363 [Coemansia sp. Benny D160-2]
MARLSMILSTGLLVIWIAVLGSGGTLMERWSGPKTVSPQVFGLLLWTRITMYQRQQKLERIEQQPEEPRAMVGQKSRSIWTGLKGPRVEEALLPRRPSALSWPQGEYSDNDDDDYDDKVQPPLVSVGSVLRPPRASSSADCGEGGAHHNSSACMECIGFSSRIDSRMAVCSDSEDPLPNAVASLSTLIQAKPTQWATKPMSMLLYRGASGHTSSVSNDLPQETEASKSDQQETPQHHHFPYDDPLHLGVHERKAASKNSGYKSATPLHSCHAHSPITTSMTAAAAAAAASSSSSEYRIRAQAVLGATKTHSAAEDAVPSAVISQDPNNVTSMIAISTVLIFATFVTF